VSALTRSGLIRPLFSVMVAVPTLMTILRILSIFLSVTVAGHGGFVGCPRQA
jgi:hypothetical protein